jgi:uncharacterized glyoxalase superfamily protein PhnB
MIPFLPILSTLAFPPGPGASAAPAPGPDPVAFSSVTPNLLVTDIEKSLAFYRDVLGFTVKQTVPADRPFVFVWLERGPVPVFLNDRAAAVEENPALAQPAGGAGLFFVITGVDAFYERVRTKATVIMPIKDQFYGMREFTVADPDGYVLTFAERK